MPDILFNQLFATRALEIAPSDQPFWYTSGLLGPFYINTHYLFGGRERADQLLELIEQTMATPGQLAARLMPLIKRELADNPAFGRLMDLAAERLAGQSFDFISGGARRDFYFSLPLAYLLKKPHLTILKDGTSYYSPDLERPEVIARPELSGRTALHVADIVTKASSFTRQWIPAIRATGAEIVQAFAMLDRCQGGEAVLGDAGVRLTTLGRIDQAFLDRALAEGKLTPEEKRLIELFLADEVAFLKTFIRQRPDFLPDTLAAGGKPAERARLAMAAGWIDSPET